MICCKPEESESVVRAFRGRIGGQLIFCSTVDVYNIFDNTPAKTDLGFHYTITWEEGVRRMVAWHDERGAIDASPEYPLYNQIVAAWQRLGENMV